MNEWNFIWPRAIHQLFNKILKLKLLNYNYKLQYIKKLFSVNAVPYRALLISRLNDLRDSAHLAS